MPAVKTHISLTVSDISKATEWYSTFFGAKPHKTRQGYANFDLDNPGLKLALQEGTISGSGSLNHLGLLVPSTDDVNAAKERLEDAGLVTFSEENVTCCYAKQDKIWVRDPDGNAWEVYALLDDMLEEDEHEPEATACCATGCCS